MGEPNNPDITAVQMPDPAAAGAAPSPSAPAGSHSPAGPAPDRADLRPENIDDAIIRLAGNSQDGIQTAGGFLARLAGRSAHYCPKCQRKE